MDKDEGSGNSNNSGGEFIPLFPFAMVRNDEREGRFVDQNW